MLMTGGKNSRMRMNVQGRLMQARVIEAHQVFAEKIRSDTFLTVWHFLLLLCCFDATREFGLMLQICDQESWHLIS